MNSAKLYGVGVGPGPVEYLTLRAAEVLRSADIIFTVAGPRTKKSISRSIVEELGELSGEIHELVFAMSTDTHDRNSAIEKNCDIIIEALLNNKTCAFATIGDPMTYSTFGPIMKLVEEKHPSIPVEVVPGITCFAALAARSRQVLVEDHEELHIVPGFDDESMNNISFTQGTTTAILKMYKNRNEIIEKAENEAAVNMVYGGKIGLDDELITLDMDKLKELPKEYLSMLIVKH